MGASLKRAAGAAQEAAEDSLRLYRTMVLIRHFEESMRRLAAAGETPGLVHLCSGQEATNVGVILALREGDYIASHHRGHIGRLLPGAQMHEAGSLARRCETAHAFFKMADEDHGPIKAQTVFRRLLRGAFRPRGTRAVRSALD